MLLAFILVAPAAWSQEATVWMELKAHNKYERTELVNQGFDIVSTQEDRVIVLGSEQDLKRATKMGIVLARYSVGLSPFDFPTKDEKFTNYQEMTSGLKSIANYYPNLVQLMSIGKTYENRDIWAVRVSAAAQGAAVPGAILMGGHHAREHVSIEVPLRALKYLVDGYNQQIPRIVSLLNNVEVFIVPMVNPDGAEFDIASGKYQMWRKNRKPNGDGSFGVDLNRNYGFGWGGGGASTSTKDETYRGPQAFSENETSILRNFIESHLNIRTLLSYHTFSKLVLWPWGHLDTEIENADDLKLFKTMGTAMAKMNGYQPMQSSDLYVASGDTCDWAYGEHRIFAFTFELDPSSMWEGGFYPGQGVLDAVFNNNIEPTLYLLEAALTVPQ